MRLRSCRMPEAVRYFAPWLRHSSWFDMTASFTMRRITSVRDAQRRAHRFDELVGSETASSRIRASSTRSCGGIRTTFSAVGVLLASRRSVIDLYPNPHAGVPIFPTAAAPTGGKRC